MREDVIDADPVVHDACLNLRVNADHLALPDRPLLSIEGVVLVRPSRPAEFRYGALVPFRDTAT